MGDIIVISSSVGRHKRHDSGRIQIYNGTQWYRILNNIHLCREKIIEYPILVM